PRPLCLGVPVLTRLDRKALQREVGVPTSVAAHVLHLAGLAREAGLDGCVASPQEIGLLRLAMGQEWVIVTPGIRPLPPGGVERGVEPVRLPDRRNPPLPTGGVERGVEPVRLPDRRNPPLPTGGVERGVEPVRLPASRNPPLPPGGVERGVEPARLPARRNPPLPPGAAVRWLRPGRL